MEYVQAPFSQEQIDKINNYQSTCEDHKVLTCTGKIHVPKKGILTRTMDLCENGGTLIAHKDGLDCPCGRYTEDWVYKYMTE